MRKGDKMSNNFNLVAIQGNLTRDPERRGNNDFTVATFSVAVNEKTKKGDYVSFIDVDVFGKLAEICLQYLKKGSSVIVSGKIKQNRFTDKNGQNRSNVHVIGQEVNFLSKAKQQQEEVYQGEGFGGGQPYDDSDETPF